VPVTSRITSKFVERNMTLALQGKACYLKTISCIARYLF
jgi:hypothetical protein